MNDRKVHQIWIEQCEAAQTIKARYGLTAAFEYLVGEKLMNFANAASTHPDFARELLRASSPGCCRYQRVQAPAEPRCCGVKLHHRAVPLRRNSKQ